MKGICLAGGLGTRLSPLTKEENKHFLPVYQKRMIEYPIKTLVDARLNDIVLVTGGNNPGVFLNFLKNGKAHDIARLYYTYQEGEGGIAAALSLAEPFLTPEEDCVVILGDNYFEDGIQDSMREWQEVTNYRCNGAHILLKEVEDPERFGVAEVSNKRIVNICEKPTHPKSNLAITGCYGFDESVWEYIEHLQPSERGELEITDILKYYLESGNLTYSIYPGYWSDMGTFPSLMEVAVRVRALGL